MSLFIRGMRFPHPLPALIEGLVDLRPLVADRAYAHTAQVLARASAQLIDTAPPDTPHPRPLAQAWQDWEERRRAAARDHTRSPDTDTGCAWMLYARGSETLGLFECEHDWMGLFTPLGGTDWSWGRYERPEGVTPAEWEARAATWTQELGGPAHWIPAHRGVRYAYETPPRAPSVEDIIAHAPSLQARAQASAQMRHANAAGLAAQEAGTDVMAAIWAAMCERAAIDALAARLAPTLVPLTPAVLRP